MTQSADPDTHARARALALAGALAFGAWLSAAAPAAAQDVQRIVAVVNDDVISNADMVNRIRLVFASSGMQENADNIRRVQSQVLRALIDEKLQLQEGQRLGMSATDQEISDAFGRIEQANQMPKGALEQFFRQAGIARSTMVTQVRAGLIWQKIVQRRLGPTLDIGNEEVNEVLARFSSGKGVTEALLAEIFLPVDLPEQEEEVRQQGLDLIERMKRGVPFPVLAQQFSQSPSAATGGDIGWVQQEDSEDPIQQVVARMEPGQVSTPIRTSSGFYLVALRERRTIAGGSPEDAEVEMAQLVLPLPPRASPVEVQNQTALAETIRETVSGCADFGRVAEELGGPTVQRSPPVRAKELAPNVRPIVAQLKVGEASAPVRIEPGLMMVMVCVRNDVPSNAPSRDDIAEGLRRQRLDMLARRYLRDLRRAAVIDVRG